MTTTTDWVFRANFLLEQAGFLDMKADEFRSEARRYRELSIKARHEAAILLSPQESADGK